MDTGTRSLVKAGSWRVIASSTTVGLIYLFTSQLILAMTLGILELVLKLAFYWAHERAWQQVDWGRPRIP